MSWIQTIARPSIVSLAAYKSARSLATQADIFLDANEAPSDIIGVMDTDLNRYPHPQSPELLNQFSRVYKIDSKKILMGRGSDEAIDLLTRAFCEPNQGAILTTPPTYGMYKVSADIQNAPIVTVPLIFKNDEWGLDLDSMARAIQAQNIKLVYVCSPNNPTGTVFSASDVRRLCREANQKSLVVVDEAYIEFCPDQSVVSLMGEFSNLVVLRTLSKAWGLAGLRCGVLLADPQIVELLQKVRAPYPLPQPVIEAAIQALSEQGEVQMRQRVKALLSERERVQKVLMDNPQVDFIFSSHANFLLVRFKNESQVMQAAKSAGIILRSRDSEPGLKNCIRITIGNAQENDQLLKALSHRGDL